MGVPPDPRFVREEPGARAWIITVSQWLALVSCTGLFAFWTYSQVDAHLASKHNASQPHPAITVTVTARPGLGTSPAPRPTATVIRYVTLPSSGGSDLWVAVAASGTAVAGLGTLALGIAAIDALRRRRADPLSAAKSDQTD